MGVRRFGRFLRAVLLIYAASFAVVLLIQLLWPVPQATPERADAIFCLGAGMSDEDEALPDEVSLGRALTCARLYADGVAPVVVFTGAGNDVSSAAAAMANVARAEGVPEGAILIDPFAHSTIQNAAFGVALLTGKPERLVLVSDVFHLPRAWVVFRVLGHDNLSLYATENMSSAPLRMRLQWSLREAVVLWVNAGRLTVYVTAGAMGIDEDTRIGWFN